MGLEGITGYQSVGNFEAAENDVKTPRVQTAPPDGYTRISIEVDSKAPKGKDGKVILADEDIERAVFNRFGLRTATEADLQKLKARLGTDDNPFAYVRTSAGSRREYRADGKYQIEINVQNSLYKKLAGKAAQIKQEIKNEKSKAQNSGDGAAVKKVFDAEKYQRAKINKLFSDVNILPARYGIPSKLTDLTHVVITLPEGTAASSDGALNAYIEKRYGGPDSNLWGDDKNKILNAAKQAGVKVENLQISPNNSRTVSFDLNLESVLKLQKAYLDVQEQANVSIDAAEKIQQQMALNQFLLGVMEGAWEDVKGNLNTIAHPIQTLQGIRDALGILAKLTPEDLKNIAAELGNRALNATPGEAAHAAGYVVGTVIVEALLAKGAGVALSALGKTKAGAEFLARIGKLAERTGELANLGKAKIAEMFSDEAASLASRRARQALATTVYAGIPADVLADMAIVAGNKLKNGVVRFGEFSKQMVAEFGEKVKPHLEKLYRNKMIELGLGKEIDEAGIKTSKSIQLLKVEDWERTGKIRGDLERLKNDLMSERSGTRIGAEAEVQELESKISRKEVPEVRGAKPGTDQPEYEVKARTEPFTDENNAQNWFNDRIKKANIQFIKEKTKGQVVINLGKELKIGNSIITEQMAEDFVKNSLAKGGRGTNISEIVIKSSDGKIIYRGLGN